MMQCMSFFHVDCFLVDFFVRFPSSLAYLHSLFFSYLIFDNCSFLPLFCYLLNIVLYLELFFVSFTIYFLSMLYQFYFVLHNFSIILSMIQLNLHVCSNLLFVLLLIKLSILLSSSYLFSTSIVFTRCLVTLIILFGSFFLAFSFLFYDLLFLCVIACFIYFTLTNKYVKFINLSISLYFFIVCFCQFFESIIWFLCGVFLLLSSYILLSEFIQICPIYSLLKISIQNSQNAVFLQCG